MKNARMTGWKRHPSLPSVRSSRQPGPCSPYPRRLVPPPRTPPLVPFLACPGAGRGSREPLWCFSFSPLSAEDGGTGGQGKENDEDRDEVRCQGLVFSGVSLSDSDMSPVQEDNEDELKRSNKKEEDNRWQEACST